MIFCMKDVLTINGVDDYVQEDKLNVKSVKHSVILYYESRPDALNSGKGTKLESKREDKATRKKKIQNQRQDTLFQLIQNTYNNDIQSKQVCKYVMDELKIIPWMIKLKLLIDEINKISNKLLMMMMKVEKTNISMVIININNNTNYNNNNNERNKNNNCQRRNKFLIN
ncbi:hypothetical protein U3516DRAFT_739377 [Neocallimastix sp. 'constans']